MKRKTNKKLTRLINRTKTAINTKPVIMTTAILPLAACGGGSGGDGGGDGATAPASTPPAPNTPATPQSDFTESPTNIFVALDDLNRTLNEGSNTANLTVTGKGGNDTITTGSGADTIIGAAGDDTINSGAGNDLVRAGEGRDTVRAGDGNDGIVIIGTTTADQYTNGAISNSGGSGMNLSSLINLADLNGRSVSEVTGGEIIDGGSGTNTLFIYGTVDLTGVTLNNVTVLVVNSDVTLTPEQIAAFTTVDGDGNSLITIEIPEGSSDNYILDLSTINLSDVESIHIDGDITVVISDASDLVGVDNITNGGSDTLTLEVKGAGAATNVNLGDIADTFTDVDTIEIDDDVTLEVDNASDITNLGLQEIAGNGEVETDGSGAVSSALDNIEVAETVATPPTAVSDTAQTGENQSITVDVLDNDHDPNGSTLSVTEVSVADGNGSVSINSNQIHFDPGVDFDDLDQGETRDIEISYTVSNGELTDQGTLTITVNGVADAPVFTPDAVTISEDQTTLIDVLANDFDPNSDLELVSVESLTEADGVVSIVDNKIQFTPGDAFDPLNDGQSQSIEIEYTVSDGNNLYQETLDVDVNGVSDGPIAFTDHVTAGEDTVTLIDVVANDLRVGDDYELTILTDVTENWGTLTVVDGKIEFTPGNEHDRLNDGETWLTGFDYLLTVGNQSDTGSVNITLTGNSDDPEAINDIITIGTNQSVLIDVLANDSGDNLILSGFEFMNSDLFSDSPGTLSIVDSQIHFEPSEYAQNLPHNTNANLRIDYEIFDGTDYDTGRLVITIIGGVETLVSPVDDYVTISEGTMTLIDVLANDNVDADEWTIREVEAISEEYGVVTIVDNEIQFEPGDYYDQLNNDDVAGLQIGYTASNSEVSYNATVFITIEGVSASLQAIDERIIIGRNQTAQFDVLANDVGDNLVLTDFDFVNEDAFTDSPGTFSIVDSQIQFVPSEATQNVSEFYMDEMILDYEIFNGTDYDTGRLSVTIAGSFETTVSAMNDYAVVDEGSSVVIDVLRNDIAGEGELSLVSVEPITVSDGLLTIENGEIRFDAGPAFDQLEDGQSAEVFFSYWVQDNNDTVGGSGTILINGTSDII